MDGDDHRVMHDQIQRWNSRRLVGCEDDSRLEARIANYEPAFRMPTPASAAEGRSEHG